METLIHKHMLVKATLGLTPNKDFRLDNDLKALVKIIDMKILSGPHTVWCDTPGNVGYSSAIIIETSSITWHSWNHTNELHLDIFSCKDFSIESVLNWLSRFNPTNIQYKFLDRDNNFKVINDYQTCTV